MQKALAIVGGLFLVLLLGVGVFFAYAAFNGQRLDASSKAYVDASLHAIIPDWSEQELLKRASPELRAHTSNEDIKNFFTILFDKLGPFKSYDGSTGSATINYSASGEVVTAKYAAHATFHYAKVEIDVNLIRAQDTWQILGFHVAVRQL